MLYSLVILRRSPADLWPGWQDKSMHHVYVQVDIQVFFSRFWWMAAFYLQETQRLLSEPGTNFSLLHKSASHTMLFLLKRCVVKMLPAQINCTGNSHCCMKIDNFGCLTTVLFSHCMWHHLCDGHHKSGALIIKFYSWDFATMPAWGHPLGRFRF